MKIIGVDGFRIFFSNTYGQLKLFIFPDVLQTDFNSFRTYSFGKTYYFSDLFSSYFFANNGKLTNYFSIK